MTIDVFVVVAAGKLSELSGKAAAAGVVDAGIAPAVAPPVAVGKQNSTQKRVVRIDRAAFPGCQMMRRIEAGRPDIAERPGKLPVVQRPERVTVVLDKSKVILLAKRLDRVEIKWVPQRMRYHNRFGFVADRVFQLSYVNIV